MNKYIGDKKFFQSINKVFWPLVIGMIMTSILTIIDMAMISRYDPTGSAVAGISSISKYAMTSGPVLFAILTGIGIFASQAYGAKKYSELKKCFGLSIISAGIFAILNFTFLSIFGEYIIKFFIKDNPESVEYGLKYLAVYKYSILFLPFSSAMGAAFRQIKKAKITMWINISTVALNTLLNFILIYGIDSLNIKSMGVEGAAYATLISRAISVGVFLTIVLKTKPEFLGKIKEMFKISWKFYKPILIASIPIIISETLFGIARFMYSKAMAFLGTEVFAAEHLAFDLMSIMNAFVMAAANTCAILIGVALGEAKKSKDADSTANYLLGFLSIVSLFVFIVSFFILPRVVVIYGSENEQIVNSTMQILKINAIFLALRVFSSGITFMVRAGGDTVFALFIDSGMAWLIGIPLTFLVVYLYETGAIKNLSPMQLRAVILTESVSKVLLAFWRFRSKKFLKKII